MPLRNLIWLVGASIVSLLCFGEANRNRYAQILSESIDTIAENYVKPVDRRRLFEAGLGGMLDELDINSAYIPPEDYSEFREEIEQEFGGIGVEVGYEDDLLTVIYPIVGTPAYEAGLISGDVLLSIDGVSLKDITMDDAVSIMRGPTGSKVRLEILRDGEQEPRIFEISRARIQMQSIAGGQRDKRGHWSYVLENRPDIGYIWIKSFGDRTADEFEVVYRDIAGKVQGLIVDLRGNPGGLLNAAIGVCDLFLEPDQLVVSTKGRIAERDTGFFSETERVVDPNLPLVILMDRYSASASEIFAACMQDYQRGVVVGERSYGKGTVQNVIEIEGGRSAFRLTTQTYWRPSGKNIHRHDETPEDDEWGVQPRPEHVVAYRNIDEIQQAAVYRQRRDPGPVKETPAGDVDSEPTGSDRKRLEGAETDDDGPAPNEGGPATGDRRAEDENTGDENTGDENAGDENAGDEVSDDAPEPDDPDPSPFVDRQLQRAIEVLDEMISLFSIPSRAA